MYGLMTRGVGRGKAVYVMCGILGILACYCALKLISLDTVSLNLVRSIERRIVTFILERERYSDEGMH